MPVAKEECQEYSGPEIVFAVVCKVGTNYHKITAALADSLRQFNYTPVIYTLSDYLQLLAPISTHDPADRIRSLMDAGNEIRKTSKRNDVVALAALAKINSSREHAKCSCARKPMVQTAHILVSLKNPVEVETLRRVYGPGFFLIGVHSSVDRRLQHLTGVLDIPEKKAKELIERDEEEAENSGQRTRKTFELSDVFLDVDSYEHDLRRFLDLVFGHPYTTPSPDEHAMFLAFGAGLRSGQLGRQVGAAILSPEGDVLATGCNDVPRQGGGLYWPGSSDHRDHILGYDSNEKSRREILEEIVTKVKESGALKEDQKVDWQTLFKSTGLWEITEYGRAVHAEMDALLTCARIGVSPVGATLYTTTFPCHNCTRHIIGAGINRVVYVEPYPKSRAMQLHFDSIAVDGRANSVGSKGKIPFEPFIGIGPRRYISLFSLNPGDGERITRKEDGIVVHWRRETAKTRVPLAPRSYLQQEQIAVKLFRDVTRGDKCDDTGKTDENRRTENVLDDGRAGSD